MIRIIRPSLSLAEQYFAMCQDWIRHSEKRYNYETIESVKERIQRELNWESGVDVPADSLPSICFWFINDQNEIIGTSRLRKVLNEGFKHFGGNIGYDVSPSFRRKGYGTEILKLTIEKAKKNGLEKVLLTCDDDNIPSYKIIEHNNGKLENKEFNERTKKLMRRYWIQIE